MNSNLESFVPKAGPDHKRIQEVFETVETGVTQLLNLNALHYLPDDFEWMSKIILKLPVTDQKQHS